MATLNLNNEGRGYSPKTFVLLYCMNDGALTPHSAGRVLKAQGTELEIEVKCRKCGTKAVYVTDQLPDGYQVYSVRLTGEDGPHLPADMRPLPFVEESFSVVATSLQDAHERADFAHSIKFSGHLVHCYINSELHLDERF